MVQQNVENAMTFLSAILYKETLFLALMSFGIQAGNMILISPLPCLCCTDLVCVLERSSQAFITPRVWQNTTNKEVNGITKISSKDQGYLFS